MACVLLRLYPAAWRERYGNELLALIDESGLTVRIVLDVVLAAGVQWLRTAVSLIKNDQFAGEPPPKLITAGYMYADFLPCAAILATTIAGLYAAGVPAPPWTTWVLLFFQCDQHNFMAPRPTSRAVRLFIWSYWLFLALALAALAGLLALGLRSVGLPAPSTALLYGTFGTVLLVGLIRAIPMRYRLMSYNSTWPGIHLREIRVWQGVWFGVFVVVAMAYPGAEMFWPGALILWMALRPPFGLTREGVARQRALKQERGRQPLWPQI
jgi:hypothetical protein